MPYAANGLISQGPLEGGIEITESQYAEALEGMLCGLIVTVEGGFSVAPPEKPETDEAPELTPEQIVEGFKLAIQQHMDAKAVAAGYDDIKTAVTYADEPAVLRFQAEGQAFRAWRSLVWAYGYEQLAAVEAGTKPQPSVAQFLAELPPLDLPQQ